MSGSRSASPRVTNGAAGVENTTGPGRVRDGRREALAPYPQLSFGSC
jgi:hypothetical protein